MIIDNILVDWQSSKKVISFPTLVISFVRSYQFSDTCHSNNSSHISDQCGQKKFIYFCWPIIFYSWYIFWYHMGLGTSKNIIIYLWFTLNIMYPNEACYTYQFCEIFSNYPCLQAFEVQKYEDIENAIKIKDLKMPQEYPNDNFSVAKCRIYLKPCC